MLSVKVDATDLKKLSSQLGSIKKSLANKGMRKALTGMCKIFRDGLKREVPIRSGLLKKSISFKVWKPKKKGEYMAKVGAKNVKGAALFKNQKTGKFKVTTTAKQLGKALASPNMKKVTWRAGGKANSVNPAHYLHLVEGGAKAHNIETNFPYGRRNTVKHPGSKARHSMAKVVQHNASRANAAAVASLEQSIKEATLNG